MVFIFRVDSGKLIGMGHLMRCRNLAEHLAAKYPDNQIIFITRQHQGHLASALMDQFDTLLLPPPKLPIKHQDPSTWLGDTIESELDQITLHLGSKARIDLLIIDHYAIDESWETQFCQRFAVKQTLVIDDLHNRNHQCDYLLDYTFNPSNQNFYRDLVPSTCQTLLGHQYILLNHLFQTARTQSQQQNIIRVNISLGGADPDQLTKQVVEILLTSNFGNHSDYQFDIILGHLYDSAAATQLEQLIQPYSNFTIYSAISFQEIIPLLQQTHVAIGAGGVSVYERACLGIPSLLINLADNQLSNATNLNRAGLAVHLGSQKEWNHRTLIETIKNRSLIREMSSRNSNTFDGLGCQRVIDKILDSN